MEKCFKCYKNLKNDVNLFNDILYKRKFEEIDYNRPLEEIKEKTK